MQPPTTRLLTERLLALAAFSAACVVAYLFYRDAEEWKARHAALQANTTQVAADARREAEAVRAKADAECRTIRQQAVAELDKARTTAANAEVERKKLKSAAELIRDQELHKLVPELRPLNAASFTVNDKYVESIGIDASKRRNPRDPQSDDVAEVSLTYQNSGTGPVWPDVNIYFYTAEGLIAGVAHDKWRLESIAPGERRIYDVRATLQYGLPVYWRIEVR